MTINQTGQRPSGRRQLPSITTIWLLLSAPEVLSLSLALVTIILGLALIIPQQSQQVSTPASFVIWVSNLPPLFQQLFQPLETLGLFTIFQNGWFWLPMAWLTLVCLVVLADYAPATWQRLRPVKQEEMDKLFHPLERKTEKTLRLSAPKDAGESAETGLALQTLQNNLTEYGYTILPSSDRLTVTAYKNHWRWSGPIGLVLGLLIIIAGIVIQTLWGQSEEVLVSLSGSKLVSVAEESITFGDFYPIPDRQGNLIAGNIELTRQDDNTQQTWLLYRPYRLNGWWVIPAKIQGIAEVTFNRQTVSEKSVFVYENTGKPILFVRSPENIALELSYITTYQEPDYKLVVVGPTEGTEVNQRNSFFSIPAYNLQGQVEITNRLLLKGYKLPGLPAFIIGSLVFSAGLILLSLTAPVSVYLKALKKGRGSKIKAEVETLGHSPILEETINTILNLPSSEKQDA